MGSTSYIELNASAVKKNFGFIKNLYGDKVKISSVVKANAYGHGIEQYLPLVEECGINHFSVFSSEEAKVAFNVKKPSSKLMIMGSLDYNDLPWIIENEIEFFVFDSNRLSKAIEVAVELGKPALIHLEIETGMNRTGLSNKQLRNAVNQINRNRSYIEVKGFCTHLAGAESIANYVRVQKQIRRFKRKLLWLEQYGIIPETVHAACSAASLMHPKTRFDMVRVGILQYGFWPSTETFIHYIAKRKDKIDPLERVISWKSHIMSIKKVKTGEFISYGITYLATEDKTIAIIPVGYSSGYSRSLSNQGRVLIHGQRVAVIGLVNMNMLIADVTLLDNPQEGDEVVIIGVQNGQEITVAAFTEISNQLNYELLARLPKGIKRIVKN